MSVAQDRRAIPAAAAEAAAQVLYAVDFPGQPWVSASELTKRCYLDLARWVLVTAHRAWPGANQNYILGDWSLVLPAAEPAQAAARG